MHVLQGASSVPFSIGSPLVEALRQQQAGSSKALTDILGSMLLGWTADRTALALDASMPRSDQNLVAEFLRSRQHNTLLPFLRVRLSVMQALPCIILVM